MRFLLVHKAREDNDSVWEPSAEFVARIGAMVEDAAARGILLSGEGVHKSDKGAVVRKARGGGVTATDGPFTEAKEVIGGFVLINAVDRAAAVAFASEYADLFEEIEVEVRQVVEAEDLPG